MAIKTRITVKKTGATRKVSGKATKKPALVVVENEKDALCQIYIIPSLFALP